MKKLLTALAVLSLNGCAIYDAYMMTNYDPNEYIIVTEIRSNAQVFKSGCTNPALSPVNAIDMANRTQFFANYSEHIPNNKNGQNAAKNLNDIAQGLADKYRKSETVSPLFCKLKFESIEHSAATIQHVLGKRPR
jgi:hypothetical protein